LICALRFTGANANSVTGIKVGADSDERNERGGEDERKESETNIWESVKVPKSKGSSFKSPKSEVEGEIEGGIIVFIVESREVCVTVEIGKGDRNKSVNG
jgi:hypothetical protein